MISCRSRCSAPCLFTLFAATGPALHFSQNEVNFLFAGPFSRRSLVVYKICAYFAGAILSAAIFALLIPGRASSGLCRLHRIASHIAVRSVEHSRLQHLRPGV